MLNEAKKATVMQEDAYRVSTIGITTVRIQSQRFEQSHHVVNLKFCFCFFVAPLVTHIFPCGEFVAVEVEEF